MTTIATYVQQMRDRQAVIARKLGADIGQVDKQTRVQNVATLVLIAAVIKTLVDKGVITDAELLATLNAARDDVYTDEPAEPPGIP
ncbi:MAG TPA: hypothetical protein VFE14_18755 [Micromonosporaceae bacterium]|jgi:hypothetical protein|nr:hypothetical protein [Micromonosporaceae bacterium]